MRKKLKCTNRLEKDGVRVYIVVRGKKLVTREVVTKRKAIRVFEVDCSAPFTQELFIPKGSLANVR